MKILKLLFGPAAMALAVFAAAGAPRAQEPDAAALLEAAIQRQWVSGDLAGAVSQYEAILDRYGSERRVAVQALWRLGQGQEQLGRLDDARRTYERLVARYPNETELVTAARRRMAGLDTQAAEEAWTTPERGPEVVAPDSRDSYEMYVGNSTNARQEQEATGRVVVFNDLAVFNPRTGQTWRLSAQARSAMYPVMSNGGNRVAYMSWSGDLAAGVVARRSSGGIRSPVELRVTAINGTNDRVLVRDSDVRWLRPFEWSADGSSILALFERESGLRQIVLVDVDTGSVRVLKEEPWLSIQGMHLSENGRVVTYQVPAAPGTLQQEYFVLPVSDTPSPAGRYPIAVGGQRGMSISEDDLVIHVLNRTGFGPRLADIERVKAMGVDAYIEDQLHPERIADRVADALIANFHSLRMELPELIERAGPRATVANRRRATLFQRPVLIQRAEAVRATPGAALTARASAGFRLDVGPDRPHDTEAETARMIRAVHSERQLQEMMVDFWMNHFNVRLNVESPQLIPAYEEQVIRQNALGRFETLLSAVAHSPAMLVYLDNWRSSAPSEVIEARIADIRQSGTFDSQLALLERMPFLEESKGLNENYARELLELHTMGVDSGYTQEDIIEIAKILTGWTIDSRGLVNGRDEAGVFRFDPLMHVDGDKVVLGQTFTGGGLEEGEQLLAMLAHRPETARFISTKLARRFVADDPPEAVVEAASRTFLRTGGDIREVMRTILLSPEFRSGESIGAKIKKPFELVASALRAVNAEFADLGAYLALIGPNRSPIARMGENMYGHEAPDGNPDVGPAWMNSNGLLVRLEFANSLATDKIRGVSPDLVTARALLTRMGVPTPSAEQIEQHRAMLEAAAASAVEAMGGMQVSMTMTGAGAAGESPPPVDPAALTVAVMLGSPQFQKR